MNNRTFKRSQKTGRLKFFMDARIFHTAVAFLLLAASAWSQSGQADLVTVLSREVTTVDEPVVLIFRFVNVPAPGNVPQTIPARDLDISFLRVERQGFSARITFGGSGVQAQSDSSTEIHYAVAPKRPGVFEIPTVTFDVGAKRMRSKKQKLRVVDAGTPVPRAAPVQPAVPPGRQGMPIDPFQLLNQMLQGGSVQIPLPGSPGFPLPIPQPGGPPPSAAGDGGEFFAEMTLGTKTAFVGQVVPVDLRFYFPADMVRDGWEPPDPQFTGDGFTVTSVGRPKRADAERNGTNYRVYTFRTAIVPAKTGELQIPPAKVSIQLIGGMFGGQEEIEVTTDSKQLRVEALPEEGRPISFSGAIGQDFELSADVDPAAAEAGEPLTYSLTVSGRGNFDAMVAPELNSTTGWRMYPPKDEFEADDTSGFGGSKTFRFKMVAKRDMTTTPGAEFSYFDPDKREYITRKADPLPVDAKGRGSAGDAPSSPGTPSGEGEDAAQEESPQEGIGKLADSLSSKGTQSFVPLLRKPWFVWGALSVALALLVALPVLAWMRRRSVKNALANELLWSLKQAQSALGKASDRAEFYNAAAHLVQARLAVGEGKRARFVDTSSALRRQVQDAALRREIESVLGRRDELKYGGPSGGALDQVERSRVVAVLEKFTNNHD